MLYFAFIESMNYIYLLLVPKQQKHKGMRIAKFMFFLHERKFTN